MKSSALALTYQMIISDICGYELIIASTCPKLQRMMNKLVEQNEEYKQDQSLKVR